MATEETITIRAVGGEEAGGQIKFVSDSLERTADSSERMQKRFQERFQHVGLQLFAGDALRASGLGREARSVIMILNMALREGAQVAGISSGGIMLVVAALGALAGIVVTVINHHKALVEELEKTNKGHHEELMATRNIIQSIQDYRTALGTVPEYLKKWEESERSLMKAQVERQIEGDKAQLRELTLVMNAQREKSEQLNEAIGDQKRLIASMKDQNDATVIAKAQLVDMEKEYKKQQLSLTESRAKIDQLIASIRLLGSKGTDDIKGLTGELKKNADEAKQLAEEHAKAAHKAYEAWKKELDEITDYNDKTLKAARAEMEKDADEEARDQERLAEKISSSMGNAFDSMLFDGKSFANQMGEEFRRMAEGMISEMIRLAIEWAILDSVTGGAAGTFGSFVSHKFAVGGEVMVDRPTMFLAGEAGPEIATFKPLSAMAGDNQGTGGGGGTTINVGNVHTVVQGVTDPEKIAQTVGQRIIQQIRGMGQLSFVRT